MYMWAREVYILYVVYTRHHDIPLAGTVYWKSGFQMKDLLVTGRLAA